MLCLFGGDKFNKTLENNLKCLRNLGHSDVGAEHLGFSLENSYESLRRNMLLSGCAVTCLTRLLICSVWVWKRPELQLSIQFSLGKSYSWDILNLVQKTKPVQMVVLNSLGLILPQWIAKNSIHSVKCEVILIFDSRNAQRSNLEDQPGQNKTGQNSSVTSGLKN